MLSFVRTALQKRVETFHKHERVYFDFKKESTASAHDERLKRALDNGVLRSDRGRTLKLMELPSSDGLRTLAGDIKQHTLDYLDHYLEQTIANAERRGTQVHLAGTAAEARRIIIGIARAAKCKSVIKSKSMVSEEIGLADDMHAAGLEVIETDLGEFVAQIDHDRPSHIVTPIIHKDKESIGELFANYFGTEYTNDPTALTRQARNHLRGIFRKADLGITGGNFIVAETGDVCSVENEGNVRQSMTTPRVLVSIVGIEKLVPRMADLAVLLKLLARSATGQTMTVYSSVFGGTKLPGEKDGPDETHLVLVDNGRTEILASEEYREILRCIRCGACLNACPVYRKIGGHSYGGVYPGPIGALLTPLFNGLEDHLDLPNASSLCGACYEACPVKINIPKHLISLRRDAVTAGISSPVERFIYRAWAWTYKGGWRYKFLNWGQKVGLRWWAGKKGWINSVPGPASGWTQVRDLPAPPAKSFRDLWNAQ